MRMFTIAMAALVLVGVVAVASASIPDVDGNIQACYKTSGGAVRLVDAPADCLASETSIQWPSQQTPISRYVVTRSLEFIVPAESSGFQVDVLCPTGYVATGGGFEGDLGGVNVGQSFARVSPGSPGYGQTSTHAPDGWTVGVANPDAVTHSLSVFAVCVTPGMIQ